MTINRSDTYFKISIFFFELLYVVLCLFQLHMQKIPHDDVYVCIISTGDELTAPGDPLDSGKIYDSNTTMLKSLLIDHGFHNITSITVEDK